MRYRLLLLLPAALLLFSACGVQFADPPAHDEFFQSLVITGDTRVDVPLTAAVSYQTTYTLPIQLICDLRKGTTPVRIIGRDEIPADPAGSPKATPVPGNFSYDFAVDTAGSYKIQCYTERDQDNFIARTFTVRPKQ